MDAFQQVVSSSALPVMVAGTPDASRVVLLDFDSDLDPAQNDVPLAQDLTGLIFLGCVGLGREGPLVAWAMPLTPDAERRLAEAYARYVMPYIETRIDVSADYLDALHSLEDPRPEYPN